MIRPIDMQMLLPRTESVGSVQQHENQSVVNANLNAANAVEKEVRMNSETVVHKEDSDFEQYKYDAREEGKGTYSKPGKDKRRKKQSEQREDSEHSRDKKQKPHGMNDKQPRVNIQIGKGV